MVVVFSAEWKNIMTRSSHSVWVILFFLLHWNSLFPLPRCVSLYVEETYPCVWFDLGFLIIRNSWLGTSNSRGGRMELYSSYLSCSSRYGKRSCQVILYIQALCSYVYPYLFYSILVLIRYVIGVRRHLVCIKIVIFCRILPGQMELQSCFCIKTYCFHKLLGIRRRCCCSSPI